MTDERKSPQKKKDLEYSKDHFTFSEYPHAFRRNWKRKKARVNRQYRRKSDELLAQTKPGISANEAELIAGDLTAAHLQKSVLRERLRKSGTVTVGEKIKLKLERRRALIGRNTKKHAHYDELAREAVRVLNSLDGRQILELCMRARQLGGDLKELRRVARSFNPIDRAVNFLWHISFGSVPEQEALRRNQELCEAYNALMERASRIIAQKKRATEEKVEEQHILKMKLRELREDK